VTGAKVCLKYGTQSDENVNEIGAMLRRNPGLAFEGARTFRGEAMH